MAALNQVFDASTVAPSEAREVIPAGKYLAQIISSEMRDTKAGDGSYLAMELEILDGEHQGRKLFERLNLNNPNATAVEIAHRTLSAICHATGQMQVADSEQLHFKPLVATVKVRPPRGEYGPSNEIGGYAPASGAAPRAVTPAAKPAASATAAAKPAGSMPWNRSAA